MIASGGTTPVSAPAGRALYDIAQVLESAQDAEPRVGRVLELLGRLVPYEQCALLLRQPAGGLQFTVQPDHGGRGHLSLRAPLERLLGLLTDHVPMDAADLWPGMASPPLWQAHLAVPVIALDRVFGVLAVGRAAPDAYGEEHLSLLSVVASQLGAYLAALQAREAENAEALVRERLAHAETGAARERATSILESITDAFFALDAQWRFSYANRRAEQLLRRPRGELIGTQLLEALPSDLARPFQEALGRAEAARVTVEFEAHSSTLDAWLEVHVYPAAEGLSVYAQDVTERRRAEARLRQREAQLAEAQAIARLGSWEWDIVRDAVTWSDELYRIYGLDPEHFEATFEGFLARVHPEEWERVRQVIETALREGKPFDVEYRIMRPDGAVRLLHGHGEVVVDAAGRPVRMVGMAQDVTERVEAEARARELAREQAARAEAERAHASLQTFLGIVAHDLRNPLSSILGYVQLLRRGGASAAPERLGPALEAIEGQARRMRQMIDTLVDAARIGAGELRLHREPTDLAALARQAVAAVQATTERHRIVLEAPERLEGEWDLGRLAQVLDNLLGNAVRYSPEGGEIRLQLRWEDDQAVISVTDHGLGMPAEDLPRLFQLFSRLETGNGIEGSGLGLYIARSVVEAHGGRIWAESPGPGQGSTFSIALPLKR